MSELNVLAIDTKQNVENRKKYFLGFRIKEAKEAFLEWSSRTDMNNYGKIFEYKGNILAQIIWIIIFLVLSGLTVVLIQQSISAYLSYAVTSTYETIYESPVEFPAITVCAGNPFTTLKAVNLFEELAFNYSLDSSRLSELIELAKMFTANPSYGNENRKKMGLSFDNIESCQFDKLDCKNDLHWIWLYDYGNCFQFNSGLNFSNQKIELAKNSRFDKGYGLKIKFTNIMRQERIFDNSLIKFENHNFVLLVHNESNIFSSSSKLSYIKTAFKLSLYLKRVLISKQPTPYSDCIDLSSYSSVLYDYIIQSNYSYRQIDCLDLCIQQKIISECGCYNLKYRDLNTQVNPCLNLTQFECANNQIINFDSAECIASYCPLVCTSIEYDLENSVGDIENEPFLSSFFFDDSSLLTVTYSSLKYTQITELPQTTLINLLAQLGGSLGMFISFSVFTLFESIELLVLILHSFFYKVSKNSQVNQIQQNI